MPRIDPSQLLRTLSVLLAKDGGIRSAEEVPRIVQLMQKFSKKLVSKCIYIHILCSSSQDLLESFLSQKGWDLLNMWFSDAIKNQNYFLCGDLVKLFAVCPMNSARLKENVEINQAPKLIRQLSCDTRIEQTVRNLALQVLQQWMSVIRTPPNLHVSNNTSNGDTIVTNNSELTIKEESAVKVKPRTKVSPKKATTPSKDKKVRSNVIVDTSESEEHFDNDYSKDYNPNEDSDIESAKNDNPSKAVNQTIKTLKRDTSKDDSTDVDDLLGGDTTSEDERPKKASVKEDKPKKDSNGDSEAALKTKKEEREREKEREKEERRRKEREREKRKAQERKDKAKPYSRTELRTSLDSTDKERIKEVAKKMKEESGASASSTLGRIPKIVRPGQDKEKKNGSSFSDMLGVLDVKKPKPKAPPIKNKNKDLLESITNPSPIKPKQKMDTKLAEEKLRKEKERRNSLSKNAESDKKTKSDKTQVSEKSPETVEKEKEKEKTFERPKPKIVIAEKTAEKRSYKDASPSPKLETKKSPSVIKESSFLGDVLGDIMKEPPRKKKRRPSDVKSEKEAKEVTDKLKNVVDKEKFPEQTNEKMDISVNGGDLAFAEPTSELPREVRGILVYVKGSKIKKKIQWRPDDKLVEIEYFEMDETERANVWKIKSFEELKKKEAMFEKSKFGGGLNVDQDEEQDEAPRVWKLISLEFDCETLEIVEKLWEGYGSQSGEKPVQEQRELRVLKSLFFNQIPCDPSEPDPGSCEKSGEEAKEIPPDDLSDNRDDSTYDYGVKDWPVPNLQSQATVAPPPISSNSLNALLKDLNPSLLASLPPPNLPPPDLTHQPPPSLNAADVKLFAAQKAAAEALAVNSFPTPPPALHGQGGQAGPPPHNGYTGYQHGYDRVSGHRGNNYDRQGFKGGNNYHHNANNYNKNYKGRDGRDNRDDHRDRGYRDNRDRQQDYKRPCKFWMERGKCKEEDRCLYPHPSR